MGRLSGNVSSHNGAPTGASLRFRYNPGMTTNRLPYIKAAAQLEGIWAGLLDLQARCFTGDASPEANRRLLLELIQLMMQFTQVVQDGVGVVQALDPSLPPVTAGVAPTLIHG